MHCKIKADIKQIRVSKLIPMCIFQPYYLLLDFKMHTEIQESPLFSKQITFT